LTTAAQAQLPNFTKVDTGAISQLYGGHISSTCFDMDNDGDQDLFVGNCGVGINRNFSYFKNERNGFYVEMTEFINEVKIVSSFGDVDNDGDPDLFTGQPIDYLDVYANDGYGSYTALTSIYSPDSDFYPTLLDINSDSFLDVIGINKWGSVLYNNGNGTFQGWVDLGLIQQQPNVFLHGVSWGDPDDDGDLDFFGGYTSNIGGPGGIPTNLCYLNDGNGGLVQFDPTSPIVEGECPTPCANWVDYDNDGDMDLYVHNVMCDNMLPALYENLGDMEFIRHDIIDEIYRHSFANSSVWGDLDNDGDLDLFLTIENNNFPWPPPYTSATPYNVIYLDEGNGQFTDILEHPLTLEDSHTALILDPDNDGDLDVLMTRYSWSNDGYNYLFVNEGNDNSWIVLTCEGTTSNRSAIGTRIQAKGFVNETHITQTREITPINGHLSYANLRVHFGLGDANVIDTLLIRWPSGNVDTYLDVEANHFYRAIENDELTIDFKATNYIQYSPCIAIDTIGWLTTIDLKDHYHFIEGDTVPQITGDTLTFSVYSNENPDVVQAGIEGSILTLEPSTQGETTIEILASAGFTERVDKFIVNSDILLHLAAQNADNPVILTSFPNPFTNKTKITCELSRRSKVRLDIYSYCGNMVTTLINEVKQKGKYEIIFNGKELFPGVYFCVLKTNEGIRIRKMIKL
nr:VCBS repeat-containing protein [Bacteroidota bacterium]